MTFKPAPALAVPALVALMAAAGILAAGCDDTGPGLKDGYYSARVDESDADGWREFLTIFVNDGTIATAEFNASNRGGMLRSWDQDHVRGVYLRHKVNPNLFPRLYCGYLVSVQDPARVQPVGGGRRSHEIFVALAEAAIKASRLGLTAVADVRRPVTAFPEDI
jgi:major membrane immunogen (membrane-anchored lipoprotein)